ncbi:MAG: ATP-binding protein [Cyanophyceae cyanobacterium]
MGKQLLLNTVRGMNHHSTSASSSSHALLEGIAIATNKLLTIRDHHDAVQQALAALGQSIQVDRIYIFENHPHPESGEVCTSQRWEWVALGIVPEIDNPILQNLYYYDFIPRWYNWLGRGKVISGLVEEFPASEQEVLAPQGIQSILVVPITIRDLFWGFIGFDDCHRKRIWKEVEQAALLALGGTIGGAIVQRRSEIQMRELNDALEQRVRDRTQELQAAKDSAEELVRDRTGELRVEKEKAEQRSQILEATLQELQQTQSQLIQTEKMSALGELIAGIVHDINNPVGFINGNLSHAETYLAEVFQVLALYEQHYPEPPNEIQDLRQDVDLDFIREDFPEMLTSMRLGTQRIVEIVRSLRRFSRTDETYLQAVDLHGQLDDTLTILRARLKGKYPIQVLKEYGDLPPLECYAGQLSQVFMNILSNAIDAIGERADGATEPFQGTITIRTHSAGGKVMLDISDNGLGMTTETRERLFESFFTTKPLGKGTGLGMAIAHRVITERHGGTISCASELGQGTTFTLTLPLERAIAGKAKVA